MRRLPTFALAILCLSATYSWDFDNDGTEDANTAGNTSYIFPSGGTYPAELTITNPAGCTSSSTVTVTVSQNAVEGLYWTDYNKRHIKKSTLDASSQALVNGGLSAPWNIALDVSGNKMYWTDAGSKKVQRANLDGTNEEDVYVTGLNTASGIALDIANGKVFWSDYGDVKIYVANTDGTDAQALNITGLVHPIGIALDATNGELYIADGNSGTIKKVSTTGGAATTIWTLGGFHNLNDIDLDVTNGKIYWSGTSPTSIMRANMDGSGSVETLVSYSGASEFYGVEVDAANGKVYYTDRGTNIVHRVNADGSGSVETLVSSGLSDPFGIALDATNSKIYWVDYGNGKIEKADLNGANREEVFAPEMTSPFGIAIDNIEGKIYWADRSTNKIYRSNLDGTAEEAIISSGLDDPFGVAIDETNRAVYWADYGANTISKADLDGSNVTPIISSGLNQPYGVALDVANNKIYWAESGGGKINYADLDGSNQANIHTDASGEFKDVALDLAHNKVYWTEAGTNKRIWQSDLDGSNKSAIISSGLSFPFGITVDEENNKIYWTDLVENKIKQANLDGSGISDFLTDGIGAAFGLALVSCGFDVDFSATTVAVGAPTTFTDASTNVEAGATYSWDFDNDGTEDANIVGDASYTYPSAGTYTAKLTITSPGGCVSSTTAMVTVSYIENAWTPLGPDDASEPGFSSSNAAYTAIAVDGNDVPYVAYLNGTAIGNTIVTAEKFENGSWVTVGSGDFSAGHADFISIAIDGNDVPYVAYRDYSNSAKATVHKFDGTNWSVVGSSGFSASTANNTEIAIDGNGIPYIVYQDASTNFKATVQKFEGGSWQTVGGGSASGSTAQYTDIAIDGNNVPYIVYKDGGLGNKATVQKFVGGSWMIVGSAGFSAGAVEYTTIAIDANNTPYVAYQDIGNGGGITVQKFDGANWEVVGSNNFSAGAATYTSIAIHSNNVPFVLYKDGANNNEATVQQFDGNNWVAVGSAGFTANEAAYPSLAIDGTGKLIVAYGSPGAYTKYYLPSVVCTPPIVSFTASTVVVGTPTSFTDASIANAGATYSWDFNNDGTEDATTAGNASYTYPSAGEYTAKLTVINDGGCTSTQQINVIVKAQDDQALREILKKVASDRDVEDRFGFSVDTYGDYVVVGAYQEDGSLSDAGAAYVFKKDFGGPGAWGEVKKLTASDAQSDDYFGYSVSMDGEYIVVGAYSEDTEGSDAGAAYVFHKDEGGADNWGQVKKLTASDAQAGDWFGYSVDISGDNVVVSVYYDDDGGSDAGAAYIFNKDKGGSNNWGQVKKLVASDAQANDRAGFSVAISGEYAVLSAHTETQGGSNAGAAYVFKKDQGGANNWGEIKKLLASDAQSGDLFGSDLSISGDHIIVGARFEDENGSNAGAAYVFSKDEGGADNWGEAAKLIASDGEADDRFGYAVAISGKYALVGAPNEDGLGTDVGAAYLFEQNAAGEWAEVQKSTASDAYFGDEYGRGLALWGDRAVIGAQMEDQDANGNNIRSQAGSVYIYEGCQPPDIAFTAEPVILGNETTFTDQSTGVSGAATYAWDFNNDGSIESTTVGDVGYTYLNTGTYTAKLTIDDDGCIISETVQTEVFEASTEVTAQSGSEQGFQCTNCSVLTQEDYTVAAGANRLMVVGVYRNASSIISVNFNGQNLTPSISVTQSGVSQFWYLPLGTGEEITSDLVITTVSTVACLQGGVTVFDYVKQDFPIGNTSSRVFNGVPGFTQYLGVETENILVDFLRISNSYNPSHGSNQTVYAETVLSGSCENRIEGSYKPASSTSEFVNWSWGISTSVGHLLMEVETCAPKASFTATTVQVGNATSFTDASTRVETGATYSWDFDDNGTEDDNTVGGTSYTYPNPGNYTAKLTITNANGCKDVETITVKVLPFITEGIFWTDATNNHIRTSGLNGENPQTIISSGVTSPYGIDIDPINQKIYWTDYVANNIQRSNFDGSEMELLVSSGLDYPIGIALDVTNEKMYWVDRETDNIKRANLDGSMVETLVIGLDIPHGIALDVPNNKMYWTDNGSDDIKRADLNGTNVEVLIDTGLDAPRGIALDLTNNKMYWVDSGSDVIKRAGLDGTNIENLVTTGLVGPYDIGLDVPNRKMYWVDDSGKKIQRANFDGSGVEDLVTSGFAAPLGMAILTCDYGLDISAANVREGEAVTFTDNTTGLSTGATYSWDFTNDGSQDATTVGTTTFTYPAAGTYTARVTITDGGCISSSTITVNVFKDQEEGILWADDAADKIQGSGLDGSTVSDLVSGINARGIDVDMQGRKMYWVDDLTDKVQRANFDGSGVEDIITGNGLAYPYGVAIDETNRKIYWTDLTTLKTQRANLDGSNIEDLFTNHPSSPFGIVIDEGNGKIYWTYYSLGQVRRANLDGTGEEVIISGLGQPFGIALDHGNGKIYFTDEGTDKIQRADLDGMNLEDIITTGLSRPRGIEINESEGKIYWTDRDTDKVQRANLDGSDVEELVTQASVDLGDLALILCDFELSLSAGTVTQGMPTPFTLTTTGLSGTPAYSWDFDADGSEEDNTAGNTTYTYASPGNYTAELTVTNGLGCKKTTSVDVTVDVNDNLSYDDLMKRVADDREEGDGFGYSVAVSGDYAVVGAYREEHDVDGVSNPLSNAGAAYVFKKNAGGADNWGQIKKLVASDRGLNDFFGRTVAIDGDYIVVGAEDEDQGGNDAGAAYVFRKDQGGADNWGEVKKLRAADASGGDKFGGAISISGDYIVVGARLAGVGAFFAGTAYIFKKGLGGTDNWGQFKQLAPSNVGFAAAFGGSVSIDGNYIVVGAGGENSNTGAAYIFKKDEGGVDNWGEVKRIIGSDTETGDIFGNQVSISGDYVLVGAYEENTNGYRSGAAYLFKKDEGGAENWGEFKKLLPADGEAEDYFAYRLALYGSYALIGAYGHDDNGPNAGIAYLFRKDLGGADNWGEGQKISAVDAAGGDNFGRSVGMHGSNMIVGAFFEDEDDSGNNTLNGAGSVYFYEGTDAAALPVTLAQFTASREGDRVRLHWQTSTEQNNYGFYIQRSRDGRDWQSLGFVAGQGDAYSPVDYHFTDEAPHTGVNYYRLKQEDYDGTPSYSEIRSVSFDGAGRGARVHPNPFSTFLTIENGRGALTVYDMLGRVLAQSTITEAVHRLDTGALPEGPCIIRLQREDGRLYAVRLVKGGR